MTNVPSRRLGWIALVILVALVAIGYYGGFLRPVNPSKERYPLRGIDVSHHQGHIAWFEASLNGVGFAYLKATEGQDFRDRQFAYNWDQTRKNQIPRGAYHYFSLCSPGAAQARNFLRTVPNETGALPPAIDLEFDNSCKRRPPRAVVIREINNYLDVLSTRYKETPVFYVDPHFYKKYFDGHGGEFPPHRLWLRNILREPSQKPCTEWTLWQFADHARIPGIKGPVDLNVYCGSSEEFLTLMRKDSSQLPKPHSAASL